MKIKMLSSFIIITSLAFFLFSKKQKREATLLNESHFFPSSLNPLIDPSPKSHKTPSVNASPTISEIENEFNHLDLKELEVEVQKINLNKDYQQLLSSANKQGLTQSDRLLLSSFLKRKGLLHKMIIERELDQIESEEL